MKRVLVALLLIGVMAVAFALPSVGGFDTHLKWIIYDHDSVLAPGVGVYYLGTTPWGFRVEHSFVDLEFESSLLGEVDEGEWRVTAAGVWNIGLFYDIVLGGCDPGPCDDEDSIRLAAGIGLPGYFAFSTIEGLDIDVPDIGVLVGVGYVWPSTFSVMAEAYWNGDDMGYGLSFHADLFDLSDWIRGH